ncbi:efflux RND transporter periplasmic adaptor subunit [Flaviaesturariibacter amylovorans]|uniref:Multidrug efflux RND transporter periplasmic adaptor subunit MexJ n=1 Tax=Flaviaesturariibacter amylovorans TaxID=1084520 RepID=A0ABP8HFC9_9BACT
MKQILYTALAALLLQACSSKANKQTATLPQKETIPVRLLAVSTESSTEGSVRASGVIAAQNEARLSFKIGGVIETINVKEGDNVRRGQLLATLKPTEIAAQVQQAQLAVEKAERDHQRVQNLYKDSVATLEQLQNTRTGLDIARQGLQQAQFNRQYANIYAPADGIIVKKIASVGELAGPGTPVLFLNNVSASEKWVLRASLSDQDWAAIREGNTATVRIDAFPGVDFKGVVSKKAPTADPASGSFTVEVQVDLAGRRPAPGMFGRAQISAARAATANSIPYEALLEADGSTGYVFVTEDRKTVKKVPVKIGRISPERVYLSGGLEGYQWVVSTGSPYLKDGSAISVQ